MRNGSGRGRGGTPGRAGPDAPLGAALCPAVAGLPPASRVAPGVAVEPPPSGAAHGFEGAVGVGFWLGPSCAAFWLAHQSRSGVVAPGVAGGCVGTPDGGIVGAADDGIGGAIDGGAAGALGATGLGGCAGIGCALAIPVADCSRCCSTPTCSAIDRTSDNRTFTC